MKKIIFFHNLIFNVIFFGFSINYAQNCKLTILTHPVGHGDSTRYDGHYGVTRSLIEGLKKINANFNYNPQSIDEVGDAILVLVDVNALHQAIQLKQTNRIKYLFAGPNIVSRFDEHNHLLASPELDAYIVPSYWVQIACDDSEPRLKNRVHVIPAGVDINYWQSSQSSKTNTNTVLIYNKIYDKKKGQDFEHQIKKILKKNNWNTTTIIYGSYSHEQFKSALEKSTFAIFLSESESQGLALAEAWAMNVPTLVWNPQKPITYVGFTYNIISSCPYLTDCLGKDWKTLDELEGLIKTASFILQNCSPRQWVIHNMSDEFFATQVLSLMNTGINNE